jgi:hypothetical protein
MKNVAFDFKATVKEQAQTGMWKLKQRKVINMPLQSIRNTECQKL